MVSMSMWVCWLHWSDFGVGGMSGEGSKNFGLGGMCGVGL